jgi:hypothetical protein
MTSPDPALQWLFWLLLAPLAYVASWVPQWRGSWRTWYDRRAEWPFMHTPLWFGGAQTTLLFACSMAGLFVVWRNDWAAMSDLMQRRYTSALTLYLGGAIVYGTWQVPYYYYALPWQSLAVLGVSTVLFGTAAGLSCSVEGAGVTLRPAACSLQLVWVAWLAVVVVANVAVGARRCTHHYNYHTPHQPHLHTRVRSVLWKLVAADGANPQTPAPTPQKPREHTVSFGDF